jgi:hypothetical protein
MKTLIAILQDGYNGDTVELEAVDHNGEIYFKGDGVWFGTRIKVDYDFTGINQIALPLRSYTPLEGFYVVTTHKNQNGEKYYSRIGVNGEPIYSFSIDFVDYWTQSEMDITITESEILNVIDVEPGSQIDTGDVERYFDVEGKYGFDSADISHIEFDGEYIHVSICPNG